MAEEGHRDQRGEFLPATFGDYLPATNTTIVTKDYGDFDRASHLDRPGVFRLNIGVGKDTYRSLFGPQPPPPGEAGVVDTGHDFTILDQLLPHPVYAPQS